ncbi:MAG: hypothetical protein J07HX64_00634 [halophilic archaeon J07HX64]|nr:MAG: hypothetical protein J07HX64_00634 [halophilic archaeon J07HX64]
MLVVAVSALIVAGDTGILPESGPAVGVASMLVYGITLGGAHLHYAICGEDGTVPVAARWRYVGLLTALPGVGILVTVSGDRSLGPVSVRTAGTAVVVFVLATYLVTESVEGYWPSRDSP